jgi:hypothetical protein
MSVLAPTDRVIAAVFGTVGGILATPVFLALARRAERAALRAKGWTA